jgi:hypothetical protein
MRGIATRCGRLAAGALLLVLSAATAVQAQNMFYREVQKDGRIYVFANAQRYDVFEKTNGAEMGVAITRLGFGPNGETVVFDSEDAVNLYNFKHDRPGEVFPKPPEAPKSPYPNWKIGGLVFGDYYYFAQHHDPKFDTQNGFWLRRAYFTYDHNFSEKFAARLRFEMNSSGQLAGGNLVPFTKDAYIRWNYHDQHQIWLGIMPSDTFDWYEGFWGLRHIEKTPADLYRIDSSRDFALSFQGPVGSRGLRYVAQLGNESGNGSETDKFKIVRFEGRYEKKPGLVLEGFFSYGARAGDADRTTAQGIAGYQGSAFRVAAQYLFQKRPPAAAGADTKINIGSAIAVWNARPSKLTLFGRFDLVKPKLGSADAGLPGADGIDYLVLSTRSPFKFFLLGLEYYLHPSVRISPNVEWVTYDDSAVSKDVVPRITLFWIW